MGEHTTANFALPFPSSTGRVALGATDFAELATTLDTLLGEKFLRVKTSATEITAKAGELVEMTAAGTVNLPKAAAANTTIGIFAQKGEVTVKTTSAEHINGGALVEGTTGISLSTGQHVVVQYDGTRYLIVSGACKFYIGTTELAEEIITDPKIAKGRALVATESKYAAEVEVEVQNPSKIIKLTPSSTRPSILFAHSITAGPIIVEVEGVVTGWAGGEKKGTAVGWIPPGKEGIITAEPAAKNTAVYTLIIL